ncbi:hypothetical protein FQZ97_1133630 [compost metagenome]
MGQYHRHQVQDLATFVADQGQLVQGGQGSRRLRGFDLVLDGLDQGVFGKGFVFVFVVFAHARLIRGLSMQCASAEPAAPCVAWT